MYTYKSNSENPSHVFKPVLGRVGPFNRANPKGPKERAFKHASKTAVRICLRTLSILKETAVMVGVCTGGDELNCQSQFLFL